MPSKKLLVPSAFKNNIKTQPLVSFQHHLPIFHSCPLSCIPSSSSNEIHPIICTKYIYFPLMWYSLSWEVPSIKPLPTFYLFYSSILQNPIKSVTVSPGPSHTSKTN